MERFGNSNWIVVFLAVLGVLAVPGARAFSQEKSSAERVVSAGPRAGVTQSTEERIYWSRYEDERRPLADWVVRQPTSTTVWCVFDNTAAGAALGDALRFTEMLGTRRAAAAFT